MLLCKTFALVPCCDVRYDFRIKTMFGSSLPLVVCKRVHVLFTLFVFVCVQYKLCCVFLRLVYLMLPVSLDCFCFVFLRLVYPMLPVSLDCFCFVFLRLVYPMLPVSLDCFCFVFLRLVYLMLPVSLDCPFEHLFNAQKCIITFPKCKSGGVKILISGIWLLKSKNKNVNKSQ